MAEGGKIDKEGDKPREPEDTLKAMAPDQKRSVRDLSPPGIGGDSDDEDGDQVHPLAASYQEVQLRKQKISASHSADDIVAKVHLYM